MKNYRILFTCVALIFSSLSSAATETGADTPGQTKTTIFRDGARQDFVILSEKSDGTTEVRHIGSADYENAINELKQDGVISVCSP